MLASMLERLSFIPYLGSGTMVVGAIDLTFTSGDVRAWVVVIIGAIISFAYAIPRYASEQATRRKKESEARQEEDKAEQERYDSLERRAQLCARCKSQKWNLSTCVVKEEYRPTDCPLRLTKGK